MASNFLLNHSPDHVPLQANSKRMFISDLSAAYVRPKITERSQLAADFQPSHLSVICGRGKDSHNHIGNSRFRILASTFVDKYSRADNKTTKMAIVFNIVTMVRQAGGHFCKYMFEKGAWFEVGDRCARGKVSSLLRDMLQTQERSSTEAKMIQGRACNRKETQFEKFGQQLIDGSEHLGGSSMSRSSSMDSLGFDHSLDIDDQPLDPGTGGHWGNSPMAWSCSGMSTDSLGFQNAQEIDFFDIDVF
jgi:hypothetical protein